MFMLFAVFFSGCRAQEEAGDTCRNAFHTSLCHSAFHNKPWSRNEILFVVSNCGLLKTYCGKGCLLALVSLHRAILFR